MLPGIIHNTYRNCSAPEAGVLRQIRVICGSTASVALVYEQSSKLRLQPHERTTARHHIMRQPALSLVPFELHKAQVRRIKQITAARCIRPQRQIEQGMIEIDDQFLAG